MKWYTAKASSVACVGNQCMWQSWFGEARLIGKAS